MKTVIFVCGIICLFEAVNGKVVNYGGTWNRGFRESNDTLEDYVDDLAGRVANETNATGLNIKFDDRTFSIQGTLVGTTLKGTVSFNNGIVTSEGSLTYPKYAPFANRTGYNNETETFDEVSVVLSLRLSQLVTMHDVSTNLNIDAIQGTVETTLEDVNLFFVLIHNFETKEQKFIADVIAIDGKENWTIKPRELNTYVLEELMINTTILCCGKRYFVLSLQSNGKAFES